MRNETKNLNGTGEKTMRLRRVMRKAETMTANAVNVIKCHIDQGWEFEGKAQIVTRYGHSNRCVVRFETGRVAERTIDPKAQGPKHTMFARLATLNAIYRAQCQ